MTGTMSVVEAAEKLGVSHKTVRKMLHRGQLRGSRIGAGRGRWRVSQNHITELCEMKLYHCGEVMVRCNEAEVKCPVCGVKANDPRQQYMQ